MKALYCIKRIEPRLALGMKKAVKSIAGLAVGITLVSGCAVTSPPVAVKSDTPPQWYAPLPAASAIVDSGLPHDASLTGLSRWWSQQNDPLLVQLIESAQQVSPSIATARSNIAQAQAARTTAGASLLPMAEGFGNLSRGSVLSAGGAGGGSSAAAITTSAQAGLQASWELDVFGKGAAKRDAAQERLMATQAQWHEARVVVAAEVASQYYGVLACQKQLALTTRDAASRQETNRLTALTAAAGFAAPAVAALARASAAEAASRVSQQAAQCALFVKGLVALSAMSEPLLAQRLGSGLDQTPPGASLHVISVVPSVPAEVLTQRPDVFSAARAVAAASADVTNTEAQRLPRLSLTGNITANALRANGFRQSGSTWSFGPLALNLPLFDGGALQGELDAANARYVEAVAKYQGLVRGAVREVEESLVNLDSTSERASNTGIAAEGYQRSFEGVEARYKAGLASLFELEESRRTLLAAQGALIALQLERRNAWVALYRALGGGWQVQINSAAAQ
jgi:outer membrane protein, multidrug efflux system